MLKSDRVAFISTPQYRANHGERLEWFVFRYMYWLCQQFEVICTGRTYDHVLDIVRRPREQLDQGDLEAIAASTSFPIESDHDIQRWRRPIERGLVAVRHSVGGMIEVAHELVEGRLDAVIHLTDWEDVAGKPDSMVLRREANVHGVPIALDVETAAAFIADWTRKSTTVFRGTSIFPARKAPDELPLQGLDGSQRVLALIAHDNMKLDMNCFVVEHAREIFSKFDVVLATGTTGMWIKRFAAAAGRGPEEVAKVRRCLSGPYGGDVQIAAAVVKGLCRKVIFLQDPLSAHPHETDIRLFEQAVLLFERAATSDKIDVELATNVASAKLLIGV